MQIGRAGGSPQKEKFLAWFGLMLVPAYGTGRIMFHTGSKRIGRNDMIAG